MKKIVLILLLVVAGTTMAQNDEAFVEGLVTEFTEKPSLLKSLKHVELRHGITQNGIALGLSKCLKWRMEACVLPKGPIMDCTCFGRRTMR